MNCRKGDTKTGLLIGILMMAILFFGYSFFQNVGVNKESPTGQTYKETVSLAGIDIMPKGVPKIYGGELGIAYDDVSAADPKKADATIRKLGLLDEQIKLAGEHHERYKKVAGKISCEYCCGVESIINKDGEAACGCAHSFAMRGLAKYLIKNHGSEFTDDQILEELGKWKTLFFPGKLTQKAAVLRQKGIELNYINIASNKYRGIENSA